MYKLAIRDRLQFETDSALPLIPHENRFSFPAPIYIYSLPTMALVHTLTAKELLDRPTSTIEVEPTDKELLDTPIFDLNITKLPPSTDVSALPMPTATADFRAMTTQITDFLKLRLDNLSTLSSVQMDESTPVQPSAMDAETNTTTHQMLTHIPEEISADQATTLDVAPQEPTAMAVSLAPQALIAALTMYHFLSPPPSMLFPKHHWMDYPDMLKKKIQHILLPQLAPAFVVPQVAQLAPVIAQAAVQRPAALPPSPPVPQPLRPASLLPLTGPIDVQTPQAPSKSASALDRHGQPILRPGR
uniref:Uncharacterized protein n=1 Tax=Romanomermis culicivorax TaxID=13658 RepID=A0A915KFN4_ROMCU